MTFSTTDYSIHFERSVISFLSQKVETGVLPIETYNNLEKDVKYFRNCMLNRTTYTVEDVEYWVRFFIEDGLFPLLDTSLNADSMIFGLLCLAIYGPSLAIPNAINFMANDAEVKVTNTKI